MIEVNIEIDDGANELVSQPRRQILSGGSLVVGRSGLSQWIVKDRRLSSRHFEVVVADDCCLVKDLESTNGTLVNNERVTTEKELNHGDNIRAGSVVFKVLIRDPQAPEPERSCEETVAASSVSSMDSGGAPVRKLEYCFVEPVHRPEQRVGIGQKQVVTFGSSSLAGKVVDDELIAGRHFQIQCMDQACVISCFEQQAPILLDGQRVTQGRLFDGDHFIVGDTEFRVTLMGPLELVVRPTGDPVAGQRPESTAQLNETGGSSKELVTVGAVKCTRDKVVRIDGSMEKISASDVLVDMLEKATSTYLIVDFFRLGSPSEEFEKYRLIDGQPGTIGCYLIPIKESPELLEWLEKIWQTDSGAFLIAKADLETMQKSLRSIKINGQPMLNVGWPSILKIQLDCGAPQAIQQFFDVVDFAFCEDDDPEKWSIFCTEDRAKKLVKVGLQVKFEPEAKPEVLSEGEV